MINLTILLEALKKHPIFVDTNYDKFNYLLGNLWYNPKFPNKKIDQNVGLNIKEDLIDGVLSIAIRALSSVHCI